MNRAKKQLFALKKKKHISAINANFNNRLPVFFWKIRSMNETLIKKT